MRVDTFGQDAMARQTQDRTAREQCVSLTTAELLRLGLSRIGYVTAVISPGGGADIVIHGADGMTVARANSVELAVDFADQLGLALVPVH